jgi:hypothetical protein
MVLAQVLVEVDHVGGVLLATGREHFRHGGVSREVTGDVIGRAADHAKALLRPGCRGEPLCLEVGMGFRDLVGAQHRAAGGRRGVGHQVAIGRVGGEVIKPGGGFRGGGEGRVRRDVLDPLSVHVEDAAVIEGAQIFLTRPKSSGLGSRSGFRGRRDRHGLLPSY